MARKTTVLEKASLGVFDGTDTNNCTVRALSNCLDMPIVEAKNLLAKHGRKQNKGACFDVYEKAYEEAGLDFIGFFGSSKNVQSKRYHSNLHQSAPHYKGMTLDTFCKTFSRGSYVVVVAGHALCIRGGKVIDQNDNSGNRAVCAAWRRDLSKKAF